VLVAFAFWGRRAVEIEQQVDLWTGKLLKGHLDLVAEQQLLLERLKARKASASASI